MEEFLLWLVGPSRILDRSNPEIASLIDTAISLLQRRIANDTFRPCEWYDLIVSARELANSTKHSPQQTRVASCIESATLALQYSIPEKSFSEYMKSAINSAVSSHCHSNDLAKVNRSIINKLIDIFPK